MVDSTSSRHVHVGTLDKSFTRNCQYDVMWRPVAALRLNSTPVIACYHPFILYFCGVSDCILNENIKLFLVPVIYHGVTSDSVGICWQGRPVRALGDA